MLVDPIVVGQRTGIIGWLFGENPGGDFNVERVATGVIQMNEFNGEGVLKKVKNFFPEFEIPGKNGWDTVECYGVCDSFTQVLYDYHYIFKDPNKKFAISITPVDKSNKDWRWIDGGKYIGALEPKKDYFHEEGDEFSLVYVYHIYELL
jgi:hypothetical protein